MGGRFWDAVTFGPQRRRRFMHRRLRELDRFDAGRSRGGARRAFSTTVLVLVAATLSALVLVAHSPSALSTLVRATLLGDDVADAESTSRASYEFLMTQPTLRDVPVTFSSCRPLELVVDDRRVPEGADGVLADAAKEVSTATGLDLSIVGSSTQDVASFRRQHLQRQAVTPALISWTTPAEVPDLRGRTTGLGGGLPIQPVGSPRLVYGSGTVALDAPAAARILERPDGRRQLQAIVMHELGHMVGLDHVHDPRELMHDDNVGQLTFGRGDRKGLEQLGRGPCLR